jgi:hypothetical protein
VLQGDGKGQNEIQGRAIQGLSARHIQA